MEFFCYFLIICISFFLCHSTLVTHCILCNFFLFFNLLIYFFFLLISSSLLIAQILTNQYNLFISLCFFLFLFLLITLTHSFTLLRNEIFLLKCHLDINKCSIISYIIIRTCFFFSIFTCLYSALLSVTDILFRIQFQTWIEFFILFLQFTIGKGRKDM